MSTVLTSHTGTGEDRGAVLLSTSLAFGIISTLVVMLRIAYRLAKRTTTISDLCIALAMVSSSFPCCALKAPFARLVERVAN